VLKRLPHAKPHRRRCQRDETYANEFKPFESMLMIMVLVLGGVIPNFRVLRMLVDELRNLPVMFFS
jgi:hypothetical protein